MSAEPIENDVSLQTVDELAATTGFTVRTTRYYASLGLIPPPIRRGRVGYYGPDHRARLELIRALQEHGFTLQGVERFLEGLPDGVTAEDLAIQRALITSWTSESTDEIFVRIARELRRMGLPKDALAQAQEISTRHMEGLVVELSRLFRDQVIEPFRQTQHTAAEAEHFEQALPRLRDLTIEAIVAAFQEAANQSISRSLQIGMNS
jgi:DNA-binding transcriptional MerR regulator